jgi:hypothetical protein
MTENPCNCSNCHYRQNLGDDETPVFYCAEGARRNMIRECDENETKLVGCMWHPCAREYLNREVIEKLKRLKIAYHIDGYEDRAAGIEDAIKLLKEGVVK